MNYNPKLGVHVDVIKTCFITIFLLNLILFLKRGGNEVKNLYPWLYFVEIKKNV